MTYRSAPFACINPNILSDGKNNEVHKKKLLDFDGVGIRDLLITVCKYDSIVFIFLVKVMTF